MQKKAILDWAKRRMKTVAEEPYERGYRYHHGLRVAAIAVHLARAMDIPSPQWDAIYVAGVLHDIGKRKSGLDAHGPRGANIIRRHLRRWMTASEMESVCRMVRNHYERPRSSWYVGKTPPRWPAEVLVIQDADIIDHYGGMEVWGSILYARKESLSPTEMIESFRKPMKNTVRRRNERKDALKSLNFPASRKELRRRITFADTFFRAFSKEQN